MESPDLKLFVNPWGKHPKNNCCPHLLHYLEYF